MFEPGRMTADEFIPWAMQQPEGKRYELDDGDVIPMARENIGHVHAKGTVFSRLSLAVERAGVSCEVYIDGMAVRPDDRTVYEPDAIVRCGTPLDPCAVLVPDPLIVVEVVSPSVSAIGSAAKMVGYFQVPSVRHYLVVLRATSTLLHYARDEAGAISTQIIHGGPVRLDPPGIVIDDLFD